MSYRVSLAPFVFHAENPCHIHVIPRFKGDCGLLCTLKHRRLCYQHYVNIVYQMSFSGSTSKQKEGH